LNHALALNPNLAEAWEHRGVVWFARQDFTQAITDFNKALKLNPRLADAHCSRGVTWLAQGKLKEAEADFDRCRVLGGMPQPAADRLLQEMRRRLKFK